MTVITLPSTAVKSDKVSLVDEVEGQQQDRHQSPPPSYDPKYLESGEGGLSKVATVGDAKSSAKSKFSTSQMIKFMFVILLLVLIIFHWSNLYNVYKYSKALKSQLDGVDADGDDDDDASVPYKSYESYAAAESDMLSMQPPSPAVESDDYDASQLNAMDGVYRKLENNALGNYNSDGNDNSPVDNSSGGVISIIDEYSEVDSKNGANNISVDPLVITKSARFIHDFSINVTGIVDVDGQCCFVMPLMRCPLTVSLYDLLFKMSSGYFTTDIKNIMGTMRVVKPAIKDLSDYGLYISKDCADYSTFKLEKLDATANI